MYARNRQHERMALWAALRRDRLPSLDSALLPWLLCGDFNCVRCPAEHDGPATPIASAMDASNSWIDEEGIMELPMWEACLPRQVGGVSLWLGPA